MCWNLCFTDNFFETLSDIPTSHRWAQSIQKIMLHSLITKSALSSWIKASVCTMLSPVVEEHGCPPLGSSYRSICLNENILHQTHTYWLLYICHTQQQVHSEYLLHFFPLACKYLIKPFMVTVIFVVISHMQIHWRVRLLQEVCIPHVVLC